MPDTYVKLPDGSYARFPEGTSDAAIESALKSFVEPASTTQATTAPSKPAAPAMTFAIVNGKPVAVGESSGSVKDTVAEFAPAAGATIGGAFGGPPGAYAGYVLGQVARDVTQHGAEVPGAYADVKRLLQDPETRSATLKGLLEGTTSGLLNYVPGMRAALQGAQEVRAGRPITGAIDVGLGGLEAATMGEAGVLGNLFRTAPIKTTAKTLAALVAGHYGGEVAKYGAEQFGASEDVAGAAQRVGNLGGNLVGIAAGEAAESPKVRQAFSGTMADRAKSAALAATVGYEVGGPKGAAAGAVAGTLMPGVGFKAPKAMLREMLKDTASEASAKSPATIAEQRLQRIDNGVTDLVGNYATASDENGVAWKLIKDSSVKKDYAAARKYIDTYVKAGQTPPPDLVTVFDGLREQLAVRSGETSASAYNDATRTLANAAREGAKSYEAAWKSLPMRMQALLRNVDSEMLDTLQMRSKNAGGKLGKPASDPWFDILNDVADESLLPQSVEVPPESPGGSATWTQPVEVVRTGKGSAVSVDAPIARPEAVEPVGSHTVATRAARRGSTVGRPMAGFDSTVLEEARMLQDMSNQYERQEGLMGGPIDDAFMARFKQLSEKFLGTENRQKYDFKTKKTTPSLSTLNGAISNRFKFLPKPMKERLGLSKD